LAIGRPDEDVLQVGPEDVAVEADLGPANLEAVLDIVARTRLGVLARGGLIPEGELQPGVKQEVAILTLDDEALLVDEPAGEGVVGGEELAAMTGVGRDIRQRLVDPHAGRLLLLIGFLPGLQRFETGAQRLDLVGGTGRLCWW